MQAVHCCRARGTLSKGELVSGWRMYTVDWTSHNIGAWERTFGAAGCLRNSTPGFAVLEVGSGSEVVSLENNCSATRRPCAQIGSWEGRSAVWLLTNLCQAADSRLVCIDTWGGAEQYGSKNSQARSMPRAPVHAAWPGSCTV